MLADRVKDTSTSVGTGNFVLSGAAPVGFQALSAIGAVGSTFGYIIDGGAEWECGIGTITAANTFSRSPTASSSGGNLVAFSAGTKTVAHVVTANQVKQFPTVADIPFSEVVPLSSGGNRYMPQTKVAGALSFTPGPNPVKNSWTYLRLVMDGTNLPADTGFQDLPGHVGYTNTNNMLHMVQFFHDGYESYRSVNPLYIVALPATAVTMTGPTSGVVNTASGVYTVGTNGARTSAVVVTPTPVAGVTFTPSSVTLPAGTATATFTATSTSTGNITIAVTNNGGLANPANITLNVMAAATAPGAPTIGAATAGDTTASFAFTAPASDGGSAITGYELKVYKVSDNSLVGTFGGAANATSITATGLTNGVAVYGKVAAINSVNTGSQSGASGNVTPASAALRLTNLVLMTETGASPNYGYAGDGGDYGASGIGGLTNKVRAANALSSFSFKTVAIKAPNAGEPMLGIVPAAATAPVPFGDMVLCVYAAHLSGTPKYTVFGNGSALTTVNSVTPTEEGGDEVKFTFLTTTTVKISIALAAAPSTYIEVGTYSAPATAQRFQVTASKASVIGSLSGTALT